MSVTEVTGSLVGKVLAYGEEVGSGRETDDRRNLFGVRHDGRRRYGHGHRLNQLR